MIILEISKWYALDTCNHLFLPKILHSQTLSFIHGIITSYFAFLDLLKSDNSDLDKNQITLMNVSRGYFLYDLIKLLLEKKKQYLYIVHHGIALYFYHIMEKYNLGYIFTRQQFLGEITNPLLNAWNILKHYKKSISFKLTNSSFILAFFLVRLYLIPKFSYQSIKIIKNKTQNNLEYRVFQFLLIIFNISNFIWFYKLIRGYKKYSFLKLIV